MVDLGGGGGGGGGGAAPDGVEMKRTNGWIQCGDTHAYTRSNEAETDWTAAGMTVETHHGSSGWK